MTRNDRQPPIYTPPDTQNTTDPNPPAGDPDPSDPFSGPVWQEGGPQIQPTGNLAELLGVPNPPMLVFDNNDNGGGTAPHFRRANGLLRQQGEPIQSRRGARN